MVLSHTQELGKFTLFECKLYSIIGVNISASTLHQISVSLNGLRVIIHKVQSRFTPSKHSYFLHHTGAYLHCHGVIPYTKVG